MKGAHYIAIGKVTVAANKKRWSEQRMYTAPPPRGGGVWKLLPQSWHICILRNCFPELLVEVLSSQVNNESTSLDAKLAELESRFSSMPTEMRIHSADSITHVRILAYTKLQSETYEVENSFPLYRYHSMLHILTYTPST